MVNEHDRAKILAFVHGELDQLETQKLATRIEAEEELRKEFESVLATSDALEDMFLKPATEELSPKQLKEIMTKATASAPKRSRKSFFIAGGAVFAASLTLVVFMKMDLERREAAEDVALSGLPSASKIAGMGGDARTDGSGEPISETPAAPVDNLAANSQAAAPPADVESEAPAGTGAAGAVAGEAGTPVAAMELSVASPPPPPQKIVKGRSLVITKKSMTADDESFGAAQTADSETAESPAPSSKKMGVVASKAIFFKGLDKKKALLQVQRMLDGKPSCVPASLDSLKIITAVITVTKNGTISKIQTTPSSPETAQCLKLRLGGQASAFKSKTGGKITLQIKNF